ncbi:MAG: hypothetical protein ACRESZ_01155 [Methylococcales bacterium]
MAQGIEKLRGQLPELLEDAENRLPARARETSAELREQWRHLDERITHYDRQIAQLAASSEPTRRLMSIEGIGPLTATAVVWKQVRPSPGESDNDKDCDKPLSEWEPWRANVSGPARNAHQQAG